jgi:hypothetical protein
MIMIVYLKSSYEQGAVEHNFRGRVCVMLWLLKEGNCNTMKRRVAQG